MPSSASGQAPGARRAYRCRGRERRPPRAGLHRHGGGRRRGGVPALRRAHRRERHRADIVGARPAARPPARCAGGGAWTFALAARRPCHSACRFPSSLRYCAPCAGVHPPARVKRVHSDCALVFGAQLAWGLCRSRRRWQRRRVQAGWRRRCRHASRPPGAPGARAGVRRAGGGRLHRPAPRLGCGPGRHAAAGHRHRRLWPARRGVLLVAGAARAAAARAVAGRPAASRHPMPRRRVAVPSLSPNPTRLHMWAIV